MVENFELLEVGQIELMHQQSHDRLNNGDADCDMIRQQHDSLAAELVKRGIVHDTEIVCPEIETDAPNYRRGFTDDTCTQCAFGQLFPLCNLYKFDYLKGYTCDSFRYFEVLELEPPHGFLMAQGKQTAIARIEPLDIEQSYLIVSNGEAFGIAELEQPAQIKTKEFDSEEWQSQHRVTPRERRQWWDNNDNFYVYRLKNWELFEGIKLYEDGRVIDEPKLTAKQWQIVSAAKELPKQITLINEAIGITHQKTFVFDEAIDAKSVENVLRAAYDLDRIVKEKVIDEFIPLYSLALVRNPRMRVSKKNVSPGLKQEGDNMPYEIATREDEFCVINTETEEEMGCHETEEEAEAQLAALRINVGAEEEAAYEGNDKPRKRKPRKKELVITTEEPEKVEKAGFMESLRNVGKSISDFLKLAETEENEARTDILTSNYGIAQKEVNGDLWHFTWSTNAFEDREKEIFSTRSLQQYVNQAAKRQDKGFFNLWHIKGTDFAEKQWQMVIGRFLVEAGPYLDDKRGKAAKEFFKEFPEGHPQIAPEGWGCSPEFLYLPEERTTGVYENIWITRTSTLPRMDAANVWTEASQLARSKNMAITDYSEDQIKTAIEVFKDEDFVKELIRTGETKTAELEAANVAHKKKENSEPEPQEIQLNMEELAAEVGKQFTANLAPMAEAIATMAKELKELKEWKEKQDEEQGIKDKIETPRYIFEWKRASDSEDTVVTEDDGLKNQKPKEAQANTGDVWAQTFNK
jgi:hypothetical protein